MVYKNTIYIEVTASDDGRANVYALVLDHPSATGNTDWNTSAAQKTVISNYISTHKNDDTKVRRLTVDGTVNGNGLTQSGLPNVLYAYVEKGLLNTTSPAANIQDLRVQQSYGVYIIAIDDGGQRSLLTANIGSILQRVAPVITPSTISSVQRNVSVPPTNIYDVSKGLSGSLEITSDVYFRYKALISTQNNLASAVIKTFMASKPEYMISGNVISGFDVLGTRPTINVNLLDLTHAYDNTANGTLRYDFTQANKSFYIYVALENIGEHNLETVHKIDLMTGNPAAISGVVGNIATTAYYGAGPASINLAVQSLANGGGYRIFHETYSVRIADYRINGILKDALLDNIANSALSVANGINTFTINKYFQMIYSSFYNTMIAATNRVYYTYIRYQNIQTGNMTEVFEQTTAYPVNGAPIIIEQQVDFNIPMSGGGGIGTGPRTGAGIGAPSGTGESNLNAGLYSDTKFVNAYTAYVSTPTFTNTTGFVNFLDFEYKINAKKAGSGQPDDQIPNSDGSSYFYKIAIQSRRTGYKDALSSVIYRSNKLFGPSFLWPGGTNSIIPVNLNGTIGIDYSADAALVWNNRNEDQTQLALAHEVYFELYVTVPGEDYDVLAEEYLMRSTMVSYDFKAKLLSTVST
jgi:hypothetical protein